MKQSAKWEDTIEGVMEDQRSVRKSGFSDLM